MINRLVRYGKAALKSGLRWLGVEVRRRKLGEGDQVPANHSDFDESTLHLFATVQPYTLTSIERVASLREAVRHVVRHGIEGAIVECGVWKGGSMMAVALTFNECNSTHRNLYLFDTFSGMSDPTDLDKDYRDASAQALMEETKLRKTSANVWAYSGLEEVRRTMSLTSYPPERIFYIEGKVEDTIPQNAPEKIAILRLDTDWFESTYHEMRHLFPRLVSGGVLIIDDYGHWQGARQAIDRYLSENNIRLLLNRIDYTGRVAVKM